MIDPGDPVRLLGQNVDYTAGIVDSHLGTVWLFIDGTIREHPVEQCVLSPNYRSSSPGAAGCANAASTHA